MAHKIDPNSPTYSQLEAMVGSSGDEETITLTVKDVKAIMASLERGFQSR